MAAWNALFCIDCSVSLKKVAWIRNKMSSVTVLVIPLPCLSVLLQDDITESIKCAKIIVQTPQAIRAWYVRTLEGEIAGSVDLC